LRIEHRVHTERLITISIVRGLTNVPFGVDEIEVVGLRATLERRCRKRGQQSERESEDQTANDHHAACSFHPVSLPARGQLAASSRVAKSSPDKADDRDGPRTRRRARVN